MKKFISILKIFKNKYLIALVFFVVWMFFFDPKLTQQITETQNELTLLQTSAETIEKYAREKYLMKKDNEDLFIVKSR